MIITSIVIHHSNKKLRRTIIFSYYFFLLTIIIIVIFISFFVSLPLLLLTYYYYWLLSNSGSTQNEWTSVDQPLVSNVPARHWRFSNTGIGRDQVYGQPWDAKFQTWMGSQENKVISLEPAKFKRSENLPCKVLPLRATLWRLRCNRLQRLPLYRKRRTYLLKPSWKQII